jgi:hypothetical protein
MIDMTRSHNDGGRERIGRCEQISQIDLKCLAARDDSLDTRTSGATGEVFAEHFDLDRRSYGPVR